MRFIYYTVTFLAALVILAFAGWEVYLHRNVIGNAFPNINFGKPADVPKKHHDHHPVKCKGCTCTDCKCCEGGKCVEGCTCCKNDDCCPDGCKPKAGCDDKKCPAPPPMQKAN